MNRLNLRSEHSIVLLQIAKIILFQSCNKQYHWTDYLPSIVRLYWYLMCECDDVQRVHRGVDYEY